jgi:hypothetical protein
MATAYDTWKTDAPCTPEFWTSADRAYIALKDFYYDGEVLDAVSIFLCSDRGPEALAELGKVIEAIGGKAKEDYIANRSFAPEG